jgi:hypothetical protein
LKSCEFIKGKLYRYHHINKLHLRSSVILEFLCYLVGDPISIPTLFGNPDSQFHNRFHAATTKPAFDRSLQTIARQCTSKRPLV